MISGDTYQKTKLTVSWSQHTIIEHRSSSQYSLLQYALFNKIRLTSSIRALPHLNSNSTRTQGAPVHHQTSTFQANGHTKLLYLLKKRYCKVVMYFMCVSFTSFISHQDSGGGRWALQMIILFHSLFYKTDKYFQ